MEQPGPFGFGFYLASTLGRTAQKIAARLRTRLVNATVVFVIADRQRAAMAIVHSHVRTIAIKARVQQRIGITEPLMVIA